MKQSNKNSSIRKIRAEESSVYVCRGDIIIMLIFSVKIHYFTASRGGCNQPVSFYQIVLIFSHSLLF